MRLNQVTLTVSDIARSIVFYQGLGLRLIVRSTDRYARFVCPDGDTTFSVERGDVPIAPSTVVLYFECDDLDARVKFLRSAGYEVTEPRDEPWAWREARLKDPDGQVICLFFAGENRRNPPWRLLESL